MRRMLAAGLLAVCATAPAWADVPRTIHYQGRLSTSAGTPLTGDVRVTIRLYDAAGGDQALWTEDHELSLTKADNGLFSVDLGSKTAFGDKLDFNEPLWLTTEVNGEGELSPRQLLSSVSYAINADLLDGLDSTALLAAAAALPADVTRLGASIETAEVTDGTLTAEDTAATFITAGPGVTVTKVAASWGVAMAATGGTITAVTAGAGLTGGAADGDAALDVGAGPGILVTADAVSVDTGIAAGQIVQLDAAGALPAVSGVNLINLNAANLASGTVPDPRLSATVSLLGQTIGTAELEAAAVTAPQLGANSVDASALSAAAIQVGDIEAGDLPAHAGAHQPGGADALPTAAAVGISAANGAGSSASLARADHAHQGVHAIAASGQPQITGDATLAAGANIALSQAGQTITIAAPAGSTGSNSAANAITIGTGSDTTLATVTITKLSAGSNLLVLANVQLNSTGNPNTKTVDVKLFRGAAQLDASYTARLGTANETVQNAPVMLHTWDTSGAGTYTFTLKARASAANAQATIRRLTVLELN